ncbi:hypothetical protein Dimus_023174 [Dionaea muscipula]
MADYICRVLRDGALEGEQAQALTIKDSIASPFGLHVFDYVLSRLSSFILAGKSQSRGLVLVAFSRSPAFYLELFGNIGIDDKLVRILDCYSDPLGWKQGIMEGGIIGHRSLVSAAVTVHRDVRDLDKLLTGIIELGKGLVGQGKDRFSVAVDSVSEMLRHGSLSSVAGLINGLRSHVQVSCTFWLLRSDLHDARANAVLEYCSSIVASLEASAPIRNGQNANYKTVSLLQQNNRKGKFHVRAKRRNGRVKLMSEEFQVKKSGITFMPVSSEDELAIRTLTPKVQFNLQLSEKEQIDRSKVILPFEHREKNKAEQIYDGRQTLVESKNEMTSTTEKSLVKEDSSNGQILYVRDSDDELPDSDEDPDDDLDI